MITRFVALLLALGFGWCGAAFAEDVVYDWRAGQTEYYHNDTGHYDSGGISHPHRLSYNDRDFHFFGDVHWSRSDRQLFESHQESLNERDFHFFGDSGRSYDDTHLFDRHQESRSERDFSFFRD